MSDAILDRVAARAEANANIALHLAFEDFAFAVATMPRPWRTNKGSSKVILNFSSEWLTAD